MSVYLHIGAPKCGSTTLQSLISSNRSVLDAANLITPEEQLDAHRIAHRFTKGWLDGISNTLTAEEEAFLDAGRGGDLLMSSEACMIIAAKPAKLEAFLGHFNSDEPMHVLSVVRRPSRQIESTWCQRIRTYRKFPKVAEEMKRRAFELDREINWDTWMSNMIANWTRWTTHPRIAKATTVHMDTGHPLDFSDILKNFTERPFCLKPLEKKMNASINGVSFRLLREFTDWDLPFYNQFVNHIEKLTNEAGFGNYGILEADQRREIDRAMVDNRLFSAYAAQDSNRPSAYDLEETTWTTLLIEARRLARLQTSPSAKG